MAYISQYEYYENSGVSPSNENWGSYQYISLSDIVNNFMLNYVGNHSILNNVKRSLVIFCAKNAIKELNYDAFKEVKVIQLNVEDSLRFVLPSDFVNWVRVSVYKNGLLFPMNENKYINSATSYLQDNSGNIVFDSSGNIQVITSEVDSDRLAGLDKSVYLNPSSPLDGALGYNIDGRWYFDVDFGGRYGLNTATANSNPTFRIDKKAGVINFSSDVAGESCVLEYISDGMEGGDDSLISVNKLFEQYIYADIRYEILSNKLGVQEYIVHRARKKRMALLRNAKIRMSGIHPGRLLMDMRGINKILN